MNNKWIVLLACLMLQTGIAFSQDLTDTIQIKKSFFGTTFRQDGKIQRPRQLLDIMEKNPEAFREMKLAKSNYDVGTVIGFIGGALIGWPLGTAVGGGDPNWGLAAIGGGLVVISIPFSSGYTKHATKAVHLYNNGLTQKSTSRISFSMGITPTGAGVRMQF